MMLSYLINHELQQVADISHPLLFYEAATWARPSGSPIASAKISAQVS
jgi:hypothetical protein